MTNRKSELSGASRWADSYGPKWYLHKDGTPPRDDDNDYVWKHGQWVNLSLYDDED